MNNFAFPWPVYRSPGGPMWLPWFKGTELESTTSQVDLGCAYTRMRILVWTGKVVEQGSSLAGHRISQE
ncbi:glutaminase [Aspergillus luchuensis]|uniref:Glutaminase n=1 Tax=Aspergillus kawachii TaxID=1069201 RepID=A0A146FTI6_ASPKA|nr:glutaminase [Aspergillus luchuensis]